MRCGAAWVGAALLAACTVAAPSARAWHRRPPPACLDELCDVPWAWDDDRVPSENPPYPQGFVLTVQVPPGSRRMTGEPLNRYPQVADALGHCWDPGATLGDRHWGAITVRVSFKRDGTVNGVPRITYVDHGVDRSVASDLRASLLSAVSRCTPLPVSSGLGRAIAGQIFSIRFVQKGTPT